MCDEEQGHCAVKDGGGGDAIRVRVYIRNEHRKP